MSEAALYLLTEAAEHTGLTVEALRQRIKRRRIVAVKGNDGLLRVRLTQAEIDALKAGRPVGQPVGQPTGQPVEESFALKALAGALHEATEGRRHAEEALHAERSEWTGRLDRLTDELIEMRRAHDATEAERIVAVADREAALAEARDATARAAGLAAELREAQRPWWRRMLGR